MTSKPIRPLNTVSHSDRQISDKPQRRSFSWDYKKDILEQIENVRGERGAIGKILRREGLYASQVATWREEAIQRATGDFVQPKRGRKTDPTRAFRLKIAKLEKQNAKLQRENQIQKTIIDFQKKLADYLESEDEASSQD